MYELPIPGGLPMLDILAAYPIIIAAWVGAIIGGGGGPLYCEAIIDWPV